MNPWSFSIVFLLPVTVIVGYLAGGWWSFSTIYWTFGVIPLIDLFVGVSKKNPTPEEEDRLAESFPFRLITYLAVPIQVVFVVWGAYIVTAKPLTFLELAGFTSSIGIMSGAMGINISHELIHRQNRFEKMLGKMMLWSTAYMHWAIEHVQGHHRWVATPRDPASAHRGESFYRFWPRTVIGTFKSAWSIEARRLERLGKPKWSVRNQMLWFLTLEAALAVGLGYAFGFGAFVYYLVQSVIGFSLLEVVNYIEHYGLVRKAIGEDKYEPVTPLHSWNASEWLTNRFLFHLQRHSDHHAQPQRRYQVLRHIEDAPQLPTGYAGMVPVALVPPLWFALMNPRLKRHASTLTEQKAEA